MFTRFQRFYNSIKLLADVVSLAVAFVAAYATRFSGLLTFEYQLLSPAEWPTLTVAVQLPVPGDDSAQRLAVRHHVA